MDNKAKKRLEVIHKKLQALRLQLAGAREQNDDPQDGKRIQAEIAALEAEATKLRAS